jgi:hypothetical protein
VIALGTTALIGAAMPQLGRVPSARSPGWGVDVMDASFASKLV